MPIGRIVRHSPWYLYAKLYSLSCLVSIFASRPVSGKIEQLAKIAADRRDAGNSGRTREAGSASIALAEQIRRIREAAEDALDRRHSRRVLNVDDADTSHRKKLSTSTAYALKTLATDADANNVTLPQSSSGLRSLTRVLRRWGRRLADLHSVKGYIAKDLQDTSRYRELLVDAKVRLSTGASPQEKLFLRARAERIARNKTLPTALGIEHLHSDVCVEDIPTIALGGSGGGYRATFGFLGAIQGLERAGVYDAVFWLGGVSGSCWTIAALYSVAQHNPSNLAQHFKNVASEDLHPMSRRALDTVARSPKGVHFLLGPLLAKLQSGNVGIGIMDMYATLTSSYQLLSRSPHARPRLSRSTFQFSRLWDQGRLATRERPMPIFTAVRIKQSESGVSGTKTSAHRLKESLDHYEDSHTARQPSSNTSPYQWWEVNPLEVGSSDEGAWIPTWAYGRPFVSGKSVLRAPEMSLAMLLGQVTSAPAGPLSGYIAALLATISHDTVTSRLLSRLNTFILHKRWKSRWGNPIRGADEPNPLYGTGVRTTEGEVDDGSRWEGRGRIKLMDSGMSNNLPNHIFTSRARQADIIMAFDMSSDVRSGAALDRLDEYAKERQVRLVRWPLRGLAASIQLAGLGELEDGAAQDPSMAQSICAEHAGKYAQVFAAWHARGNADAVGLLEASSMDEISYSAQNPDFFIVYCPLLPNAMQPDFDPTTSTFSTSYNLIWTPEQVETLLVTARANAFEYAAPALRRVYAHVYQQKRRRRLARSAAAER